MAVGKDKRYQSSDDTPVLLKKDPTKISKAVGVINLDSLTKQGAESLLKNRYSLNAFFIEQGKVLAHLAT